MNHSDMGRPLRQPSLQIVELTAAELGPVRKAAALPNHFFI
jgi:hypothetical protein